MFEYVDHCYCVSNFKFACFLFKNPSLFTYDFVQSLLRLSQSPGAADMFRKCGEVQSSIGRDESVMLKQINSEYLKWLTDYLSVEMPKATVRHAQICVAWRWKFSYSF